MSRIINPHTGMPSPTPGSRKISDADLEKILHSLNAKSDNLNVQLVQLGLFTEFIFEKLASITDENGTPLLSVEPEEFQEWSNVRWQQIRESAAEQMASEVSEEDAAPLSFE